MLNKEMETHGRPQGLKDGFRNTPLTCETCTKCLISPKLLQFLTMHKDHCAFLHLVKYTFGVAIEGQYKQFNLVR